EIAYLCAARVSDVLKMNFLHNWLKVRTFFRPSTTFSYATHTSALVASGGASFSVVPPGFQ
ncbi:hypothetical protein ACUOA8_10545, partial [Escherichia sp. SS-MK2]